MVYALFVHIVSFFICSDIKESLVIIAVVLSHHRLPVLRHL